MICNARANADEFPFPRDPRAPEAAIAADRGVVARRARSSAPPADRRGGAASRRSLDRLEPALVHAHFGPNGCDDGRPSRRRSGVPLVTSLYGVDAAVLPYLPQWRDHYARLFRDGDLFLAEGPEMRKKIIAAGAPADRTIIHPIALELSKYPRWNRPADADGAVRRPLRRKERAARRDRRIRPRARARAGARVSSSSATGPDEDRARALVDDSASRRRRRVRRVCSRTPT